MQGALALAVVLASQGTAARRGEPAPGLDGVARRLAPGLDARAWVAGLTADRIWLERDWSLLAGVDRWVIDGEVLTVTEVLGASPWRPAVDDAERALRRAIEASAATARRDGHHDWVRYFEAALASDAVDDLLLAPGAPLEARRLSGLVGSAWCFGGMGSWNDVAADEVGLHDALVVAQVAAVNAA